MTLLDRIDGRCAEEGVSYLELAELLMRLGANAPADLEQLWRRIVFRVKKKQSQQVIVEVVSAVKAWRSVATERGLSRVAQDRMQRAFRVAEVFAA